MCKLLKPDKNGTALLLAKDTSSFQAVRTGWVKSSPMIKFVPFSFRPFNRIDSLVLKDESFTIMGLLRVLVCRPRWCARSMSFGLMVSSRLFIGSA